MRRAASVAWLWIAIALAIACGSTDKKPPTGDQGDGKGGAEASASGSGGDHAMTHAARGAGGMTGASGGDKAGEEGGAGRSSAAGSSGSAGSGGVLGSAGRSATGGAGASGGAASATFYLGADVTDQEPAPAAALDDLFAQLIAHGFNFIRVRTFVDPKATDGYDKAGGYGDTPHTIAFGKRIKAAGMGLLIDFHYSDNWADPGKQCVPIAWQRYTTIAELATAVHDYTKDAIIRMIAGDARPDMVQLGNEITPGMLIHRCDGNGQPTGNNPVTGSTSDWTRLGMLLNAAVAGVKEVDAGILISLHIDRGNAFSASKSWIDSALQQGVAFDAFGESCYQKYQGDPSSIPNTVSGWTTSFAALAAAYPKLKFFAAEYGPLQRQINDVLFNLPNQQGLGTFDWEPTTQGDWNADSAGGPTHALLMRSGSSYRAEPDLALYEQMKLDYADRL